MSFPLILFVTGTSPSCSTETIYSYFLKFGKIRRVKIAKTSTASIAFLVYLESPDVASRILNCEYHYFLGRKIQVQTFSSGNTLHKKVKARNNRRILVKKLPSNISEKNLKIFLESMAGSVESMYAFTSDQPVSQNYQNKYRRFNTYSILFETKESAKNLLNIGSYLFYPGDVITTFEKFKPQIRNESKKHNTVKADQFCYLESTEINPLQKESFVKQKLNTDNYYGVSTNETIQYLNSLESSLHSIKPTSKIYHSPIERKDSQSRHDMKNLRIYKSAIFNNLFIRN